MRRFFVWALVLALFVALPVSAQETRGNIAGTVKDSTGVIPGATVTTLSVVSTSQPTTSDANVEPLPPASGRPSTPLAMGSHEHRV